MTNNLLFGASEGTNPFGGTIVSNQPEQPEVTETVLDGDIINVDGTPVVGVFESKDQSENMDIAVVSTSAMLVESESFKNTLKIIPETADKVDALLSEYRADPYAFMNNHDEEELDAVVSEINKINQFSNSVKSKRKDIKKYFEDVRDDALSYLDERLRSAEFDRLVTAQSDVKQLKNDLSALRVNSRWEELKPTFEANLQQYPIIASMSEELQDFSRFKMIHGSMVSGAKTKPIKKKDHTDINNIMYGWSTALESIKTNVWGLSDVGLATLLNDFIKNPTMDVVTSKGQMIKEKEVSDIEAQKQREILLEKERLENLERQKAFEAQQAALAEQQRQAQLNRSAEDARLAELRRVELDEQMRLAKIAENERLLEIERLTTQFVRPEMRQSYPQIVNYIFSNPSYRDIHTNNQTKASVIYDVVSQMGNPQSVVSAETGLNPDSVLNLIHFLLNA